MEGDTPRAGTPRETGGESSSEDRNPRSGAGLSPTGLLEPGGARLRFLGSVLGPEAEERALEALIPEFLERPSAAEARYSDWIEAGIHGLVAPTLHLTPANLKPLRLAHRALELNQRVLEVVRAAATSSASHLLVSAQVGPLRPGWQRDPAFFAFDEAYVHYHEQAKGLALAAPDLVLVRGIGDLRLLRAALVAVRELWTGPVMVLFPAGAGGGGQTLSERLAAASEVVASMGVEGMGAEGAEGAELHAAELVFRDHGFTLVGSTLPPASSPRPPAGAAPPPQADRTGGPVVTAAERIAVLGRSDLDIALLEGEDGLAALRAAERRVRRPREAEGGDPAPAAAPRKRTLLPRSGLIALEARWSPTASAGAQGPAVPAGHISHAAVRISGWTEDLASGGLRRRQLEERVAAVEARAGKPLVLVAEDPLVLEAALKATGGRSIAYLDSLDPRLWESLFYLGVRYGAKLGFRIAPASSEAGGRLGEVSIPGITRLLDAARDYKGIAREDIFVDPLVRPAGGPVAERETVEAVLREMPWAKRETGVRWILAGHHLAELEASATFQAEVVSIALFQGLDAVIIGPEEPHLISALNAYHGWE